MEPLQEWVLEKSYTSSHLSQQCRWERERRDPRADPVLHGTEAQKTFCPVVWYVESSALLDIGLLVLKTSSLEGCVKPNSCFGGGGDQSPGNFAAPVYSLTPQTAALLP